MANTRLEKTFTASNRKTFTISTWIKRSGLTANHCIYGAGTNDSTDRDYLAFLADSGEEDKLYFNAKVSSSVVAEFYTNRRFRDVAAFYHIVLAFDTTQATDTNRMKLYVNGELQSFQSVTYPNQNRDMNTNNTVHKIGSTVGNSYYFDGSMSHFHFCDGTALAPTVFGSTDSTTGEWKINTSPSFTLGTNGFTILKDGNTITDQSSNSNDFSLGGGTLTNTEDCPSNVFATLNPLSYQVASQYASVPRDGNTTTTSGSGSAWGTLLSTIGASSGKYYCEGKVVALGSYARPGICDMSVDQQNSSTGWYLGETSGSAQYSYNSGSGEIYYNNSQSSYGNTFTTGDIIGIAMDLDNSKLYFSKNGTWQNSGVPTSGSTGTGAVSITAGKTYGFAFSSYASTIWYINFGNGYFSTGAVASAGTNASGNGIFEYDVPAGYTALSTKGLNL